MRPGEAPSQQPSPRGLRIEIAPRTVLLLLLAAAGVWLLMQLVSVVMVIMVALILVGTLNPVVGALTRRGMPKWLALLLIFVALVAGFLAVLAFTIPPLIEQVVQLFKDAPAQQHRLSIWLSAHEALAPLARAVSELDVQHLATDAGDFAMKYSGLFVEVVGYAVTTLVLALYILADGRAAVGAAYAVVPRRYHVRFAKILLNLEVIVGGYMRGQLITSLSITAFTFVLLSILGVKNALALAVFAGATDVLPFIGGLLATAPAVIGALQQGFPTAGIVLAAMFVYQEFETRILVPRVYGKALRLSAAVVIVAILVGGTLMGILGALLALPIAAAIQMIARELRVELPGDDSEKSEEKERDDRAERKYEALSSGAEPVEAAVIATEIAQEVRTEEGQAPAPVEDMPLSPDPKEPDKA